MELYTKSEKIFCQICFAMSSIYYTSSVLECVTKQGTWNVTLRVCGVHAAAAASGRRASRTLSRTPSHFKLAADIPTIVLNIKL